MKVIMDGFNKTNQTYIGKLFKKLLLVGCLGILTSFLYAGGPCDPNDDMFACGLPNAIPVSIHYRQINFPSSAKVTIRYIPKTSWNKGKMSVSSCINSTTHKDVTEDYQDLVNNMNNFGGKDNYYCVNGLVANRTQSTTTYPIQIGADGLGIPDAILDNMLNPEENSANSYLFNILSMDSSNDLLGSETGKKDINLYYMNALFYNNSTDSSVQPVRWIPGHKGPNTEYKESILTDNIGVFQIEVNGNQVGSVSLKSDGNLYYSNWNGKLFLKGVTSTANNGLTNVSLLSSITPESYSDAATKSSNNINVNIILACTNPTDDQMEPCDSPGASPSECAIQCDPKNLPIPKP